MTNNTIILHGLDAALKSLDFDAGDLGDSVLQPGKMDAFVRTMQRRANVLSRARFIPMDSQQEDIDRISFGERVVTETIKPDGTSKGTEANAEASTSTNRLNAVEIRAKMELNDRTLRRNIERQGLAQTLEDLFGEAAGRDVEEVALLSIEDTITDPAHLGAMDGWIELAGNKVYNIDTTDADYPTTLFDAMIEALPKQYLTNPDDWVIYCPYSVKKAYRDWLKERGTGLGDDAITGSGDITYEGFPITVAPMLERSGDEGVNGHVGDVATLQNPDNMAWGIFHEMRIEPDRSPQARKTEWYLTMEGDANYEDENAAVTAYLDKTSAT